MLTLACRGCCCGTGKHPDVDHAAHLQALADAGTTLEVTPCLGPCRWSNVVVAVDEGTGAQTWFARVLDEPDLQAVVAWLSDPAAPRPEHLVRTPSLVNSTRVALIARHRLGHPGGATSGPCSEVAITDRPA